MRIDSSQADERASKAAMAADLNITGEVQKISLTPCLSDLIFSDSCCSSYQRVFVAHAKPGRHPAGGCLQG